MGVRRILALEQGAGGRWKARHRGDFERAPAKIAQVSSRAGEGIARGEGEVVTYMAVFTGTVEDDSRVTSVLTVTKYNTICLYSILEICNKSRC